MALVLEVRTAYGTGADKLCAELLHLAAITQCVICTDFEGLCVTVSPGERLGDVTKTLKERIARHDNFKAK